MFSNLVSSLSMGSSSKSSIPARSPRVMLHPLMPVMYFDKFIATTKPEVKFNDVPYYENYDDYEDSDTIRPPLLRAHVAASHNYTTIINRPKSLMTLGVDDIRPAHLPLLKDLDGYMHKGVSCFVKWLCENAPEDPTNIIPSQLTPIFDMKPLVDPDQLPVFALPIEKSYIFFGASTNAMHAMKVTQFVTLVKINVYSDVTNDSKTHYHYASVEGEQEEKYGYDRSEFPEKSYIILWNCRSVHRPSFCETFHKLCFTFNPIAVVLTEARGCKGMVSFIRSQLQGVYDVEMFGGENGFGGAAMIWDKASIHPKVTHRTSEDFDHQMGVNIQPGWKSDGTPTTMESKWFDDDVTRGSNVTPKKLRF